MGFVGPVTHIAGAAVRPHDVALLTAPAPGATEAIVERVVHLGFEVRIELATGDGRPLFAQLTRPEVDQLELTEGQIVYVRPRQPLVAVAA